MAPKERNQLVFLPLGGVGEIGMNLAMYGFGPEDEREWIVVDCGVTFPGPDLPGADLVLPDIRYLEAERHNLRGIVITHAHEDHYGALSDLWPRLQVPVYMTPFAAGLLQAKFQSEPGSPDIPVTLYGAGERFRIGPFEIQAIGVTHSIPEPVSLAIRTPLGTVLHTGDWKMDPAPAIGPVLDEAGFHALGTEGVLAMMCDSTNALREGVSPSEKDVAESLALIIAKAEGRVFVTSFSSNVGRIRSIAEAAREAGRSVMMVGRSMKRVVDVASELGYIEGLPEFLSEDNYETVPRDRLVVILTGSQGEPRAALAKIARGEMRNLRVADGDTVIYSSRTIPGNERAIIDTMNLLIDQGVRIVTSDDQLVHVSGHPRRNELRRLYSLVRPRILIPVHGEAAHLSAQAELARGEGVGQVLRVRNGDVVKIAPGPAEIIDQAPVGRLIKDGRLIGDVDEVGINERRKLSYVGHVGISLLLDQKFNIAGDPELETVGLPENDARGDALADILFDAAIGAVESIPRVRRKDLELVRESVRRAIRAAGNESWGKKPVVTVFIARL